MNCFLCTAYGDNFTFYGGGLDVLTFQGVCQGNGVGLAVLLALSICFIHMLYTYGHTSTITSTLTISTLTLSGLLFVDNIDLFILENSPSKDPAVVISKLQARTRLW